MACVSKGPTKCCYQGPVVELELDFTREYCERLFRFSLGGNDGCITSDGDGLTLNSQVFSYTPKDGNGIFDNFKQNLYYHAPIFLHRGKETIAQFVVSAAQYFNTATPFPADFAKRLRNIYADPRLANATVSLLDPDSGIIAGYALTNMAIFALYGRLPICTYTNWCAWTEPAATECKPCKEVCTTKYNCYNFWEDCRYISFKQSCCYQDYIRFVNFRKWCDYCDGGSLDIFNWKLYGEWVGKYGVLNGDGLAPENHAMWRAFNDWTEYNYFLRWYGWETQEKGFYGCKEELCLPIGPCAGTCAKRALERFEGQKCFHSFCGLGNCYDSTVTVVKAKEAYPYQFGVKRCCIDYNPAYFLDLVEVARREACDPLCDFWKLAVGINPCKSTINWYINQQLILTHVGIGRRMSEEYRVRENGGYAEDVLVRRVLVDFGTGSLLDASLPTNYNRARAKDDVIDMTNLVPLQDDLSDPNTTHYYQIYHNKLGALTPVVRTDTFAVVSTDSQYRLFGQGAILKLRSICVVSQKAHNAYHCPVVKCRPPCGTCNDKPGYCGQDGYESDECADSTWNWDCCLNDVREMRIEGVPGLLTGGSNTGSVLPINPLLFPLGNANNPVPFGTPRDVTQASNQGNTVPFVITRRPESEFWFQRKCGLTGGQNPYQ